MWAKWQTAQVSWLGLCEPGTSPWLAGTTLPALLTCHPDDEQTRANPSIQLSWLPRIGRCPFLSSPRSLAFNSVPRAQVAHKARCQGCIVTQSLPDLMISACSMAANAGLVYELCTFMSAQCGMSTSSRLLQQRKGSLTDWHKAVTLPELDWNR